MTMARGPRGAGIGRVSWPLSVLRVFFGIVYLTNGLAKITGTGSITIGPWRSFLINYDGARGILQHDAASSIRPYHDVVFNVILPHYSLFGALVTVAEIAVGIGLVSGILGRLAALGGALLALNVQIAAIGGGEWTFEYLVEVIPLLYLAAIPSGHVSALERIPGLSRLLTPGCRPVDGPR